MTNDHNSQFITTYLLVKKSCKCRLPTTTARLFVLSQSRSRIKYTVFLSLAKTYESEKKLFLVHFSLFNILSLSFTLHPLIFDHWYCWFYKNLSLKYRPKQSNCFCGFNSIKNCCRRSKLLTKTSTLFTTFWKQRSHNDHIFRFWPKLIYLFCFYLNSFIKCCMRCCLKIASDKNKDRSSANQRSRFRIRTTAKREYDRRRLNTLYEEKWDFVNSPIVLNLINFIDLLVCLCICLCVNTNFVRLDEDLGREEIIVVSLKMFNSQRKCTKWNDGCFILIYS